MDYSEDFEWFSLQLKPFFSSSEIRFLYRIFLDHHQENKLNVSVSKFLNTAVKELQTGKPYQQILGETEFFGLKFFVDENVLIPRPETEELLELAIKRIQNSPLQNEKIKILDIGTGSGIIPIILKKKFPNAEVFALDFSEKSLEIAKKNADLHGVEIHLFHQNYLENELTEVYDVIISNPPYIGIDEQNDIENSVKNFEPNMALFSPVSDPLIFYRKIARDAVSNLNDGGIIFLESNQKLGPETQSLFFDFTISELIKDLSGNDRFVVVKK